MKRTTFVQDKLRGWKETQLLHEQNGLAITRNTSGDTTRWTVTHINSGCAIASWLLEDVARKLVSHLAASYPWDDMAFRDVVRLSQEKPAGLLAALEEAENQSEESEWRRTEEVPVLYERCDRRPPDSLYLWHPSTGATMGRDDSSFSGAKWFARGFVCWDCRCVVNRRLREGRIDRWLLRRRVVFVEGAES